MPLLVTERPSDMRADEVVPRRRVGWELVAISSWLALIVVAHLLGRPLSSGSRIILGAPPIAGRFEVRVSAWILPVLALAPLFVIFLPRLADKLSWRKLLAVCWLGAAAWSVALALSDGPAALAAPLKTSYDYLANLRLIDAPQSFLSGFAENLSRYSVHAQGHPPGFLLFLWGLDRFGLCKPPVVAGILISVGASATSAALISFREVAGEKLARRVAPFLVLAPAAIWIATSADAFYAGVAAWSVALLVLASGCQGKRSRVLGVTGGILFGLGLHLSYGLVLAALIPAALLVTRRRFDVVVSALTGAAFVTSLFVIGGFWWVEGLLATRQVYLAGIAAERPYFYFLLAGAAAFAVAAGPVLFGGLGVGGLTMSRTRLLAGGAVVALILAALSGLSKGEVERIWLFLIPWALLIAAAIPASAHRRWLAAQVITAVAVQTFVVTPW